MDRVDQIRQSALAFAVEFHSGTSVLPETAVATANVFHKFLLGAPASSTAEDVVVMEQIIREDEAAVLAAPEERTYTGDNVVALPADVGVGA